MDAPLNSTKESKGGSVFGAPLAAPPKATPRFRAALSVAEELQGRIVARMEALDGGRFAVSEWTRPEGGGGRAMTLRGARIEKAGVNVSAVHGAKSPLSGRPFHATGLSVIVHPMSPHAPTAHMNVRFFEEGSADGNGSTWYGGGMDLTPMGFPKPEDTAHFLKAAEAAAADAGFDPAPMRARADAYFFVKHRNRTRGVGGIFFDEIAADEKGEALYRSVGSRFLDAYGPILERRLGQTWTEAERLDQLRARGVYVEFNLLYDRGTRFGFESGGNPDAILASLPPLAAW
ncbi:MAG: coproporphyrinogen III oxidase [Thermoplasmatota archaeon]